MSSTESPKSPTPSSATYNGSCHCARVSYTVTQAPPLSDPSCEVTSCNCSICFRNGYLLIYVLEKNVAFVNGAKSDLKRYTFGPKHKIAHYFCAACGVSCFAQSEDSDFSEYLAVNVRTFNDIDLKALKLKQVDGKSY